MVRFDISGEGPITLFPMFNILICVLGVLIFFFSASIVLSLGIDKNTFYFFSKDNKDDKTPKFLEWNGENLIIHPSLDTLILNEDMNKIKTWKRTYNYIQNQIDGKTSHKMLFSELKENNDSLFTYVFVRQAGFDNFKNINGFIQRRIKVDIGYELILNEEKIKIK